MLKQFIEQLSTDMRFEQGLEANDDGSYSLRIEPDIEVHLKEDNEGVIRLYAQLASLPSHDTDSYLLRTMIANLFGKETGGAFIGLDSEGKKVVLVDFLLNEQNYRLFYERLEDFANYVEAWRDETVEFNKQKESEE